MRRESSSNATIQNRIKAWLRLRVRLVFGLLVVATGFIASCATPGLPPPAADPSDPIRFHTWEDYYERGRRRILDGRIQAAREDFETCLGIRRGARRSNDQDSWRVRTHGMHIFDGYFPNRELGICHYHQGDLGAALRYLQLSISQTRTERAESFINRVHADLMAERTASPPRLILDAPHPRYTRADMILVAGAAVGQGKVVSIRIQGEPILVPVAVEETRFEKEVPVTEGRNRIEVVAEDLKGQTVRAEATVIADWKAPYLSAADAGGSVGKRTFRIEAGDDNGLRWLSLNGSALEVDSDSSRAALTVEVSPGEPAVLVAADLAGNEISADLWELAGVAADSEFAEAANLLADAGEADPDVGDGGLGPDLRIQHERTVYVVHRDRFFLDGEVIAIHGLRRLQLDGEDLLAAIPEDAARLRFAAYRPVQEGTNTIVLAAEDALGQERIRRLTVIRRPPDYVRKTYRLAASVPPLHAGRNPADGAAWQTRIVEHMVNTPQPRFNLQSLDEDDLHAVLTELKLQTTDFIDPRARIEYSRISAAELSFNGMLVHHREGIELRFHLVDASTGDRHGYVDVYIDQDDPAPDIRLDGLVSKIERHYPVVSGRVKAAAGTSIRLDTGEEAGLNAWARFLVVRPGPDGSMDGGTLVSQDGRVVELQMVDVGRHESVARSLGATDASLITEGDYVYAR